LASIEKRGKNSYRLTVVIGFEEDGTPIRERKTIKANNPKRSKKGTGFIRGENHNRPFF